MHEGDAWAELEILQQRMYRVLDRLQQVHAKLASTAVTADRISSEMSAIRSRGCAGQLPAPTGVPRSGPAH